LSRSPRPISFAGAVLGLLTVAALAAGCGNTPVPSPSSARPSGLTTAPAAATGTPKPDSTPAPTPTPGPTNPVATITLVAAIGESEDGTPSALAWQGVQEAASLIGATPLLVTPGSMAEVTAAVKKAAEDGVTIVVTVSPEAAQAVLDNAGAAAETQFFELDQTIRDGAPANVHGLVFDEAEAGYLAGFVAASDSTTGTIGLVGFAKTDVPTANYANGFHNGAIDANPAIVTKVAFANRSKDPAAGRTTAAGLVKAKADVILALADLTGAGVMREACARKAGIVALDVDAALVLPDVEPCLIVSVLKRYDVAAREAILRYSRMEPLASAIMFDVAAGGISLSDFHKPESTEFMDGLAGILAAMEAGPPHPTPTPSPTPKP
jgi:basic membrane protein A and related proteins